MTLKMEHTINFQMAENFFKLGTSVLVLLWFGINAVGWCRDPLATKLREKIKDLENEIDNLNEVIESSNEERDFLLERLNSVGRHVRALQRTIADDSDTDSQTCRKRPRVNT